MRAPKVIFRGMTVLLLAFLTINQDALTCGETSWKQDLAVGYVGMPSPGNAFTFSTPTNVKATCYKGQTFIEITASGGTQPYSYFVIPEEQWTAGDQMYNMLYNNNFSRLYRYTYDYNVIPVQAGSQSSPRYYWVAVQDAAENGIISGTYMLSWWKRVTVTSNNSLVVTATAQMDLMTTCPGSADGRISVNLTGATPLKNGYKIYYNGVFVKVGTSFETPANLAPGQYELMIQDSLNCAFNYVYEVNSPKPIAFNIDHADAGCEATDNQLWIASVDASSGSGAISIWRWRYSTDPAWASSSAWYAINTKVTGLPAGTYYVEVKDGNGCRKVWSSSSGDQGITIGQSHFKTVWKTLTGAMTIYVVAVRKDGTSLVKCDEVAVYDDRLCVGTVKLDQVPIQGVASTYGIIRASKLEFGRNNGYTPGHKMSFKIWDRKQMRQLTIKEIQFVNPANWREVSAVPFTEGGTAYVRLYWDNAAPVAHAGPDQTVNESSLVTLDGSASSDVDGDALTYMWTVPAGITVSSDMAQKPTFTAPEVTQDTPYQFLLMVNDGVLNSAHADTVVITVRNSSSILTDPYKGPEVSIYPNPTDGILYIRAAGPPLTGSTIQVFNSLGQLFQSRLIEAEPYQISLTGQPDGWYFIRIIGDQWIVTRKFLLERTP